MSLNNEVPLMRVHDELLTSNQCKDLRRGVICDELEVRVSIRATEFYIFC